MQGIHVRGGERVCLERKSIGGLRQLRDGWDGGAGRVGLEVGVVGWCGGGRRGRYLEWLACFRRGDCGLPWLFWSEGRNLPNAVNCCVEMCFEPIRLEKHWGDERWGGYWADLGEGGKGVSSGYLLLFWSEGGNCELGIAVRVARDGYILSLYGRAYGI